MKFEALTNATLTMSWLCVAGEPHQLHASRTGPAAWITRRDLDRPGNVGHYLESNDIAIAFAHEGDYGISMLQEPWIKVKDGEARQGDIAGIRISDQCTTVKTTTPDPGLSHIPGGQTSRASDIRHEVLQTR